MSDLCTTPSRSLARAAVVTIGAAVVVVVAVVVALLGSGATRAQGAAPATVRPVQLSLSPAQQVAWLAQTATPEGRAQVVDLMRTAFAGVATVGTGPLTPPAAQSGVHTAAYTTTIGVRPALATGITGDHFWVIVSYADVANGAIAVAERACEAKLPGWLCSTAGDLLSSWASGWGWASNHGVWAAIYWLPPHVTGGRW